MKLKTTTQKVKRISKSKDFNSYNPLELAQLVNSSNWTNQMVSEYYGISVQIVDQILEYYKIRELYKLK